MPTPPAIVVTDQRLDRAELARLVQAGFGNMVKFVVDIRRRVMAVGGELHADGESLLLQEGSAQDDLWGGNYYPGRGPAKCVQFTALINIRPARSNPSMEIADPAIREVVRDLASAVLGAGEPL
jgi:hypothetical protein